MVVIKVITNVFQIQAGLVLILLVDPLFVKLNAEMVYSQEIKNAMIMT